MKALLRVGSLRRFLGPLLVGAMLLPGCGDEQPPRGELMIALSTDMSVPKDVARVRIEITTDSGRRYEFNYDIAPDGKFYLPGTIAVVAGEKGSERVQIKVIGIKRTGSELNARTLSKVVTTIPKERIALVPLPIQWLCDGSVVTSTSPDADATPEYESTCAAEDGQERACWAGECVPVEVKEEELPDFIPGSASSDPEGGAPIDDGSCFDTVACFDAGQDVQPDQDCSFIVQNETRDLNVGLRLAPGGDGICDENDPQGACYVPLSKNDSAGWREVIQPDVPDERAIFLPKAVCEKLEEGSIQAVRVTAACPTKAPGRPTCGPWSKAQTATEPVPGEPLVIEEPAGEGGASGAGGEGGEGGQAGNGGEGGQEAGVGGSISIGGSGTAGSLATGGTGGVEPGTGGTSSTGGTSAAGTTSTGGTTGTGGMDIGGTGAGGVPTAGTSGTAGDTGSAGSSMGTGGTTGSAGTDSGGTAGTSGDTGAGATGATGPTGGTGPSGGTAGTAGDAGAGGTLGGSAGAGGSSAGTDPGGAAGSGGIAGSGGTGGGGPTVTDCVNGPLLFADPALDARLHAVTGAPAGPLMPADVAGLTSLNASALGIQVLDGIECLTDLTVLDLSVNQVSELTPLATLTGLVNLDLSDNNLFDLTQLSGLSNLTRLVAATNDVVDLTPLVDNPGIGTGDLIDLTDNPIDCELQGFNIGQLEGRGVILGTNCYRPTNCVTGPLTFLDPGLEAAVRAALGMPTGPITHGAGATVYVLDASLRNISSLEGLECLAQLQSLDLSGNFVSSLTPLGGLDNLTTLKLGGNAVSDIELPSISNLISLQVLFLQNNYVFDVSPLAGLYALRSLHLDSNVIADVSPLGGLSQLTKLTLANNDLTDLTPLLDNQGLDAGDFLDITANPIDCAKEHATVSALESRGITVASDCPYGASNCADGPLTFVDPNLEAVVRSAIGVPTGDIMPGDIAALTYLTTGAEGGAGVYDLAGIECLTALTSLNLTDNFVQDIGPLSSLTNLDQLWLSGNLITDLGPLSTLTQLYTLDAGYNGFSDLSPLTGLTGLGNLWLYGNDILDLTPLVNNAGLGVEDYVDVTQNPFDCELQGSNISALQSRGISLFTDCSPPL